VCGRARVCNSMLTAKYKKVIFKLVSSSKADIFSRTKTHTQAPSKMAKYVVLVSSKPKNGLMRVILLMDR